MEVTGHRIQSGLVLNEDRFKASLKHVSAPAMLPIKSHGIGGLTPPQTLAQTGAPAAHLQVIMIVHQDEGVNFRAQAFGEFGGQAEKSPPILIPSENSFAAITSAGYVVPAIDDLDPQRARQGVIWVTVISLSILWV